MQMVALYQVKENRTIVHAGIEYGQGEFIELTPELALHHAPNIQCVGSRSLPPSFEDSLAPGEDEDDGREP